MKKSEIKVGGHYLAKVSEKLVTVRVDAIREVNAYGSSSSTYRKNASTAYDVTNLATGCKTTFRSAAKFRREVKADEPRTGAKSVTGTAANPLGRKNIVPGKSPFPPTSDAAMDAEDTHYAETDPCPFAENPPTSAGAMTLSSGGKQSVPFADPTPSPSPTSPSATPTSESSSSSTSEGGCNDLPTFGFEKNPSLACVCKTPDCDDGDFRCGACGKLVRPVPPSTPLAGILRNAVASVKAKQGTVAGKTPTPEQQAILDAARGLGAGDVLVIEAGAGAGKTSTLVMLEQVLGGVGQYTAFNTSLVKESASKFRRAQCNTTHSLAFRAVGKQYAGRLGGARVRSDEVARMLGISDLKIKVGEPDEVARTDGYKTLPAGFLASQVMGAIKRFCQSADREVDGGHFKYIDGLDMPTPDGQRTYANNEKVREHLLPFAAKAWADICKVDGQLPFSHDCYVKIWQLGKPVIAADYILLDEDQDTAAVMVDILRQQKALIILVGDEAQSIYEWRGSVNATEAFPEATRLYLTQSFRFGPAIASVANQILEKVGTKLRLRGLPSIDSKVQAVKDPKCVLCRTNAVAVGTLLRYIGEGKRPFLVGGGSDVIAFVEGAKKLQQGQSTSHPDLACFSSWGEVQEYAKLDEGEDLKLLVKLIDGFGCDAILNALRAMPQEKDADVTICTAHKSKGREWDSVKLASDFPTLSKSSEPDLKLLYVAATRVKLALDVTECPFFTGEDALEILPAPSTEASLLPPTPAAPPVRREGFSWAKGRDGGWSIRGEKGHEGETVEVVKRDGSKQKIRLGKVVREFDDAVLYERG